MIKIVAISDTHGSYQPLLDIYNKEFDADYFFHLGDFCIPDYLVKPFLAVKGNNDYSTEFPYKRDLNIKGLKVHLEHGDGFNFIANRRNYLKDLDCDLFIFGHTHQFYSGVFNEKTILVNPGSLTKPRDDIDGSYAVILIDDDNKIHVERKIYLY